MKDFVTLTRVESGEDSFLPGQKRTIYHLITRRVPHQAFSEAVLRYMNNLHLPYKKELVDFQGSRISRCKFTSDGSLFVTANLSGQIVVYDTRTKNYTRIRREAYQDAFPGFCDMDIRVMNFVTLQLCVAFDRSSCFCFCDKGGDSIFVGSDSGMARVLDLRMEFGERKPGSMTMHYYGEKKKIMSVDSRVSISTVVFYSYMNLFILARIRHFLFLFVLDGRKICCDTGEGHEIWCLGFEIAKAERPPINNSVMVTYAHFSPILPTDLQCYFSPASLTGQRFIYSGTVNGSYVLVDPITGRRLYSKRVHSSLIQDIAWNPNCNEIVTTGVFFVSFFLFTFGMVIFTDGKIMVCSRTTSGNWRILFIEYLCMCMRVHSFDFQQVMASRCTLHGAKTVLLNNFCNFSLSKGSVLLNATSKQMYREMQRRLREMEIDRIENATKNEHTFPLSVVAASEQLSAFAQIQVEEFMRGVNACSAKPSSGDLEAGSSASKLCYPMSNFENFTFTSLGEMKKQSNVNAKCDRGFHIIREEAQDEYLRGIADDVPADMEQFLERSRSAKQIFLKHGGSDAAVEGIYFQHPHQQVGVKVGNRKVKLRRVHDVNAENLQKPPSEQCCSGCGAPFHCIDSSLPGFLPQKIFDTLYSEQMTQLLCRRCHLLKEHNFLINVTVSSANYEKILSHLRIYQEVLIVLIVDLLDFPCSLLKSLPDLLGSNKSMIVVANKVDLLSSNLDQFNVEKTEKMLFEHLKDIGFCDHFNVMHTAVISAKTGWGVEKLISFIQRKWGVKGDIYLVGCTNAGKSTLFNTFLQSDMCKVQAVDLIERATASLWPGTTLNLLKFPVLNPTARRLAIREARLRRMKRFVSQLKARQINARSAKRQYNILHGYMDMSFKGDEENKLFDGLGSEKDDNRKKEIWNPDHPDFKNGKWCFDTPGTVNGDQIINLLTLQELVYTIPRAVLKPRKYCIYPEMSLLVGGLARLDSLNDTPCTILAYASDYLPMFVLKTGDVGEFYKRNVGTDVLKVPCGSSEERLSVFPPLLPKVINFSESNKNFHERMDVVLSSVGWISVKLFNISADQKLTFCIWTPHGKGIYIRPSLL
ncbi:hypothetical protein D917_07585 [Trichinella nativa]|uniref:Uncharacterized protein n=1 Tax=Trichinella nativa TaxID=6335 RepID=A0A1Y3EU88_9BILA|nr:hypothetical protein D917_07585 [Trichinella nativa]